MMSQMPSPIPTLLVAPAVGSNAVSPTANPSKLRRRSTASATNIPAKIARQLTWTGCSATGPAVTYSLAICVMGASGVVACGSHPRLPSFASVTWRDARRASIRTVAVDLPRRIFRASVADGVGESERALHVLLREQPHDPLVVVHDDDGVRLSAQKHFESARRVLVALHARQIDAHLVGNVGAARVAVGGEVPCRHHAERGDAAVAL